MADFYVATTGNDTTGDGSVGNPWATHSKAVSEVVEATTIHAAAGTYDESSAPIAIQSKPTITFSPTGEVDVQVADHADGGVDIDNSSVAFLGDVTSRYKLYVVGASASGNDVIGVTGGLSASRTFTADYLELTGAGDDGLSVTGDGARTITVTLRNCKFYGNNEDGYSPHESTISYVTDCEFYENDSGATPTAGAVWYGKRNLYHDNNSGGSTPDRKSNFTIFAGASGSETDSKFYGSGMLRQFWIGTGTAGDFTFVRPNVSGGTAMWVELRGGTVGGQTVRFVSGTFGGTMTGNGMADSTSAILVRVEFLNCVLSASMAGSRIFSSANIAGQTATWKFTNCLLRNTSTTGYGLFVANTAVSGYIQLNNCVVIAGANSTSYWGIRGANYEANSTNNVFWAGVPKYAGVRAEATDVLLTGATDPLPDLFADYFPHDGGNCDIGTGSISARSIGEYDLYGRPKLDYSDSRGAVYPQHNTGMMLPMQMYPADNTSMVGLLITATDASLDAFTTRMALTGVGT